MKKIINRPEDLVGGMCGGMILVHPELALDSRYRVLSRRDLGPGKVRLISGGGSGHEPAHGGFVGKGLLDAAVCGDVFASPSQVQVYQAIRATASQQGTLLVIKNYSGDMMNFTNAAHMAREDGIQVDWVKVDDDIAVEDSLYTVGRRGVAGTLFVHKIAGAAAEQGQSLAQVKAIAEKVAANTRSIGFALDSCTVPANGAPTFSLGEGEMEYGVGIHGEPGIRREPLASAAELAERMTEALCRSLELTGKEPVALLVNGLGATPLMELYLLSYEVTRALAARNIQVAFPLVGNYMTSIDMAGASVSLLRLDAQLQTLLEEPCRSPALCIDGPIHPIPFRDLAATEQKSQGAAGTEKPAVAWSAVTDRLTLSQMQALVAMMGESILRNEADFCQLDAFAGDGDFGTSVAKGFRQLQQEWSDLTEAESDLSGFLHRCALVIMEHCGGASGPIWGSAFRAAARQVAGKQTLGVGDFAAMLQAAVEGVQAIGQRTFGRGAEVGDKTLIDALIPCADAWKAAAEQGESFPACFRKGAEAAVAGAKATEAIVARMGRAGTVGERSLGHPDAGAFALGVIFTDIAEAVDPA